MLSLSFRIAAAPVTPKLPSPSHQLSPHTPACKRAAFTATLADGCNSPAGDHPPPAAICYLKGTGTSSLITDLQRLSFLTRPLAARENNTSRDTGNHGAVNPKTSLDSIFPVHGPFELLHCLQTGGFGTAWAAKDRSTGRLLCLKVSQPSKDCNVRRSVNAELRAFRRMAKPEKGEKGRQFVMELNRSFTHGTDVFFAMELMATDLSTYLFYEPDRCTSQARRWTAQMALGIESLHEMGIIHRDIKTENILIDTRENIRIIDFGLACSATSRKPVTEFLGTPPYMAPEVLRNKGRPVHRRRHYGIAVDWWGLGCIMFELQSRDHQILFNTEEDVHAYVAWHQRPCQLEQTYSRFDGVDPVVVDLLEGLLQVQSSARYSLNDLEKHAYFLRPDGTSEFDSAAVRALQGPIRPELVPQFPGTDQPIVVVEAAKPGTANDWTNWKWALRDG